MPKPIEMWPPGATGADGESVKVLQGNVEQMKSNGWTDQKPKKGASIRGSGAGKVAQTPPQSNKPKNS